MIRPRARGFTLVEVLVALMIVALGLTALMVAVSGTARTSGYLRDKTLAQWIALNRLTEVRLNVTKFGQNTDTGELDYANRKWHYDTRYFDTSIASMKRVVVRVYAGDAKTKGNAIAQAVGFLGSSLAHAGFLQCGLDSRFHSRAHGARRRLVRKSGFARHADAARHTGAARRARHRYRHAHHRDAHAPGASHLMPPPRSTCRRAAGFTLIEILVALLILAIMAALGYSTYRAARISAERTETSLKRSREIEFGMRIMVQDFAADSAPAGTGHVGPKPATRVARHAGCGQRDRTRASLACERRGARAPA